MSTKNVSNKTSIVKDWGIAAAVAAGLFAVLAVAGWVDTKFNFTEIYNLVDIYDVLKKIAVSSALVWTVKKFVFTNTLGKDFGDVFDSGWKKMDSVEKTRWMLGSFLVLFVTIMFSF
jgi:hypothetical protein